MQNIEATKEKFYNLYFQKLCEIANIDFETIDFYNDEWYEKYSWTTEEEELAIIWVERFLTNNKELKNALINKKKISKKDLRKCSEYFVFDFGWKMKDGCEPNYVKRWIRSKDE